MPTPSYPILRRWGRGSIHADVLMGQIRHCFGVCRQTTGAPWGEVGGRSHRNPAPSTMQPQPNVAEPEAVPRGWQLHAVWQCLAPPNAWDLDHGKRPGDMENYVEFIRLPPYFNIIHFTGGYMSNWRNFEAWRLDGLVWAAERTNKTYKEVLGEFEAPPMDIAIRDALADFVARRKSEGGAPTDF